MKAIIKDKNNEVRIAWVVLLSTINFFISIVGMNLLFLNLFPDNIVIGYGLYCVAACTLCIFFTRFLAKHSFSEERLKNMDVLFKKKFFKKIIFGLTVGFITNGVWTLVGWYLGQLDIMYNSFNWDVFVSSFFAYLAVGVVEECTFRGLIDTAFSKLGPVIGIIASALLFAFMHGGVKDGYLLLLERLFFGVLFSLLMRRTHSLIFVMSAHFSHNFVYTAIVGIGETDRKTLFSTLFTKKANFLVGGPEEGSLILIIILLVIIFAPLFSFEKGKKDVIRYKSEVVGKNGSIINGVDE